MPGTLKQAEQKIAELEEKLKEQRSATDKVFEALDIIVSEYKSKQAEKDSIIDEKQAELNEIEKSIEKYISEKQNFIDEINLLKIKGDKYDSLNKNLDRIRIKAELDAFKLVDDAEIEAMESISMIDVVAEDFLKVKKDLFEHSKKLDSKYTYDLVEKLYKNLKDSIVKILKIKTDFYEKHSIEMTDKTYFETDEDILPYMPARRRKKQ